MNGAHVAEVYSQPRVTAMAPELGLSPGFALDLFTLDPEDNMPWDFKVPANRDKAVRLLNKTSPAFCDLEPNVQSSFDTTKPEQEAHG